MELETQTMNEAMTLEVLNFFFPNDPLPAYSRQAQEFAVLILGEALYAAKLLQHAFLPPTSMPRVGWLLTTAAKQAWAAMHNQYGSVDQMPAIVHQRIQSVYRSVYNILVIGEDISGFINSPRPY